ncbi:MAG: Glucodextranase, domain [Candidatus Parcubacteria bacterium]|jgi:hypothetical protein|nr:Glucodextranase, domain [Candidatus Parcubacteria bacterium]
MPITRTTVIRYFRAMAFVVIAGIIVAYAIWRSLNYARGPVIVIFEPPNGSAIASSSVEILGRAERVSSLSLNGDMISVDESGNFKELVVVFPGLNKVTFLAHDQFGRNTRLELDLVGTAPMPILKTDAVTTVATSSDR